MCHCLTCYSLRLKARLGEITDYPEDLEPVSKKKYKLEFHNCKILTNVGSNPAIIFWHSLLAKKTHCLQMPFQAALPQYGLAHKLYELELGMNSASSWILS